MSNGSENQPNVLLVRGYKMNEIVNVTGSSSASEWGPNLDRLRLSGVKRARLSTSLSDAVLI